MLQRSVRFAVSLCAVVLACGGSFLFGYRAGYLEALHEAYYQPAIVIRRDNEDGSPARPQSMLIGREANVGRWSPSAGRRK
jgi:hypothetical protein